MPFLKEKVSFTQMPDIVEYTMENSPYSNSSDLDSDSKFPILMLRDVA